MTVRASWGCAWCSLEFYFPQCIAKFDNIRPLGLQLEAQSAKNLPLYFLTDPQQWEIGELHLFDK